PFSVTLESGGVLQVSGNDGRSFVLDDPADVYDGTYTVDPVALGAGPVGLVAPVLGALTAGGSVLAIRPALFAYDPALGSVTISYTSNGTNPVDATTPDAPRLLIHAADAGNTITVTATASQGGAVVSQASNTVAVAALPDPFSVTLESAGLLQVSGNDGRSFVLDDPADVYDGTYTVDPVALGAGPVGLVAPVLRTLTTAEAGAILAVTPALFAYDPAHGPVTISYTSNGTNAVDATNPEAPSLLIDVADAGNTLTLTATASQGGVPVGQVSNTIAIIALPNSFEVMLESNGTLQINGNDGRSFDVDDSTDTYDGTYSVDPAALAAGPVTLMAPQLNGTGEAGTILTITPALFAYDINQTGISISYSTNATNAVDTTNPDAPTLLLDAADTTTTVIVTATATQGGSTTASQSNSVTVSPAGISAMPIGLLGVQDSTSTPSFSLDLSGAVNGDKLVLVYGTDTPDEPAMTVGGVSAGASLANTGSNSFGARIWVFEYTLTGPGSADTSVNLTLANAPARHMLTAVLVKGAARDAVGVVFQFGIGTASASVTPTDTANAIIAIAMGRGSFFGAHTWTNAAQDGPVFSNIPGDRASALAFTSNVPAAPYSVSFNPDPSGASNDEVALAVLAYS
ncbi:MAG: hypothetical protein ABJC93_18110, partial [Roseobacter sp.]